MRTLSDYLTVSAAAKLLGVTATTLRNWDRAGKLKPARHPLNGYRLYCEEELKSLLRQISGPPEDTTLRTTQEPAERDDPS
jgi:excisionase family DNA binding protein